MKNRNLYIYLGQSTCELAFHWKDMQDDEAFYMVDKDNAEHIKAANKDQCKWIDFSNQDQIQEMVCELMPLRNIVICPVIDKLSVAENVEAELADLLRKIFIITRMLYLPVMRSRDSRIWYLDFSPLYLAENTVNSVFLYSFSAGLDALSKVASLELAKKKINVNSIRITKENYATELGEFLNWAGQGKLFLTAQALTV